MMKIHQKVEETCKECEGMPAMLDVFDTLTQFENDDDTEELVMDLASASSSPFKFGQNYQTMVHNLPIQITVHYGPRPRKIRFKSI